MSLQWKHYVGCFSKMRLLAWDQRRMWGGCGIDKETDGLSSSLMGPDRLHDNALCLRALICRHLSDVCPRCARQAIWGASVGRWSAPGQHSCRPIHISGSSPVEQRAMQITEASCYGDSP